jgi:hypothetical protein
VKAAYLFNWRGFNGRSCTRVFSGVDLLETGRRIILDDNNLHNCVLAAWVCPLLRESAVSIFGGVNRQPDFICAITARVLR